jgi:hypothetical protein
MNERDTGIIRKLKEESNRASKGRLGLYPPNRKGKTTIGYTETGQIFYLLSPGRSDRGRSGTAGAGIGGQTFLISDNYLCDIRPFGGFYAAEQHAVPRAQNRRKPDQLP